MNNLKNRLLSSIKVHGRIDIFFLFMMFPEFSKMAIYRTIFTLRNEGWIKVKKTRTIDGIISANPNVRMTKKELYKQLDLL